MIWWRRPARNAGLPVIPNRQSGRLSHHEIPTPYAVGQASCLSGFRIVYYDKTFENYSRRISGQHTLAWVP